MLKVLPLKKRLKLIRKFTDAQLIEEYNKGLSDGEISRLFDCSKSCVQMRRYKLGLPSKHHGLKPTLKTKKELRNAYKQHNKKNPEKTKP